MARDKTFNQPAAEPTERAATTRPAYQVEALAKGLRLLGLFSERRTSMKLTEMATATSMPLPTAFRLAATLMAQGFLEQLPDGAYRPASKVLTLGFAALRSLDLVELAEGPLRRLADQTAETVNLGVLSDDRVTYLVRLRNNNLVTANIQVGSRLPAVGTSIGKMLLSGLDRETLQQRLTDASFADVRGPNAIHTLDALRPALARIHEQGWAIQDEELAHGLRSVAAPIRDASKTTVAAANIAVPAMEFPPSRLMDELLPPLRATCQEISHLLGDR